MPSAAGVGVVDCSVDFVRGIAGEDAERANDVGVLTPVAATDTGDVGAEYELTGEDAAGVETVVETGAGVGEATETVMEGLAAGWGETDWAVIGCEVVGSEVTGLEVTS